MNVETKKNQHIWLVVLIVICMGIILIGGVSYVNRLRDNLRENAIQNVMTVTVQQQQAIDNFIAGDRERLHSFADFYSVTSDINADEVWQQLGLFSEVDAIYSVMCLDEGWFCSSSSDAIRQVDEENLSFYTYIADNSGDVYMMLDHTTEKLEYVTPNVERVLGVNQEGVIEFLRTSDMTQDPEAALAFYDEVNALAPGEAVKPRRTERINFKTGEHRWFLENAYCAVIQGKPKRVVYISDHTRERETQNNLLEALKIAQTANSAKSSFLSSVSHDIRTPMNAIIGFNNLLREEAGNPEVVLEYTQRIDAFSREQTAATRQIQGTGLGMAITKSLVDLMGGTIDVKSTLGEGSVFTVELELYIQEREDDPRFWTKHKVSRMIVADDDEEICKNVVKVMAATGVAVDYATDGETAIRMMRENREDGKPYDLILLDWQMPDLNGLETARLIRENYPERIPILLLTAYDWSEIEQEAKEIGVSHFMPKPFFMSTFKDSIERIMGGAKDTGLEKDDILKDRRVLVVDDIELNRMILVKILTTLGAVCDEVKNGQEAVEKFESSQPGEYDLILMDIQMPVMNGYEATRAIRASEHPSARSIAIVAMTANAFVDDIRSALEAGMDAHIAKPIIMDRLTGTIREVLERKKQGK